MLVNNFWIKYYVKFKGFSVTKQKQKFEYLEVYLFVPLDSNLRGSNPSLTVEINIIQYQHATWHS